MAPVRTRFAPSPTGDLHLGNIRAAVFNWLFSRRHGGAFVLRLEDTDVERNVDGAEERLAADLRWLGLEWDEGPDIGGPHGPYRQSERGDAYAAAVERLTEAGHAFACFCDEIESEDRRYDGRCRQLGPDEVRDRLGAGEPHVVRFAGPREGTVVVEDVVRGAIEVPAADVDDFVLVRRDGRPTYNFAVVVDDIDMQISHVLRGSGHLSNTPKQALLFDAFAHPRPVFAHLAQVLSPSGGKLSKRAGAKPVREYRAEGYLPDAIVNYLSLLGWSDPDEREVLTPAELISVISLERLGASDTAYDPEKLRWVAGQHMARLDLEALTAGVSSYLKAEGAPYSEWEGAVLGSAVEALKTRLSAFGDVVEHLHFFYPTPEARTAARRLMLDAETPGSSRALEIVAGLASALRAVDAADWSPSAVKAAIRQAGGDIGAKGPALYTPLRLAVTAQDHGPDVARILHVIGRDEALARLDSIGVYEQKV